MCHVTSQGDPAVEDLEQVDLRGARVMAQKVVPREVCGGDSERQMECILLFGSMVTGYHYRPG